MIRQVGGSYPTLIPQLTFALTCDALSEVLWSGLGRSSTKQGRDAVCTDLIGSQKKIGMLPKFD